MKKRGRRAHAGVMMPRRNWFKAHQAQNPALKASRANQIARTKIEYRIGWAEQAFGNGHGASTSSSITPIATHIIKM